MKRRNSIAVLTLICCLCFVLLTGCDLFGGDPVQYNITIDQSIVNGTVSCDKETAEAGETINLTVEADPFYQLVKLTVNGEEKYAAIASGFVKVNYNVDVKIIASAAEWSSDIDIAWAKRSEEDALKRIENSKTDEEKSRAELKLKRAQNRISVYEAHH
jgi:hypothetical protein